MTAGVFLFCARPETAGEKGCVFYSVTAMFTASESAADSLAMPETDNRGVSDALSFASPEADLLADATASSFSELDDKSAWQSLLA